MDDRPEFYKLVPKGYRDNLEWRLRIREAAAQDAALRNAIWQACRQDILFFLNGFAFLYEPRVRSVDGITLPHEFPFLTWEHQDPLILACRERLDSPEKGDIGIEKSRGEGISWIGCMLALHDWLFCPGAKVGMVSSTEEKAADIEDSDSLMWKILFQLEMLPKWMSGVRDKDWYYRIDNASLVNKRNKARVNAYSATGDVARGGRAKFFLFDEHAAWERGKDRKAMASLQHVTDHRLHISTPQGAEGAFYDLMHKPSTTLLKLRIHWSENPWRNRGLYRYEKGQCIPVDVEKYGDVPEGYAEKSRDLFSSLTQKGFRLEGTIRSPWYDGECDRAQNPQEIAQELDVDYGGSMYQIYGPEFAAVASTMARPPMHEGELKFSLADLKTAEFVRMPGAPMKLWMPVINGQAPQSEYVLGADIASGQGGSYSSNSVVTAIDRVTRRQVLEMATNIMEPRDFANMCISLAYWLHGAFLCWEHAGPGVAFTKVVLDSKYEPVYRREVFNSRTNKRGKAVGWFPQPEEVREDLHAYFSHQVRTRDVTIHSQDLVRECAQYVRLDGKIAHIGAARTEDDSSKGKSHGDRVVAFGVALQGLKTMPAISIEEYQKQSEPPMNTLAARVRDWEKEAIKRQDEVWDDLSVGGGDDGWI